MTINSFIKRFSEMECCYVSDNISFIKHCYFLLDWFFAYVIHGASISDYFAFSFFDLRHSGRRKYITYRRHLKIQDKCNAKDKIEICRNKILFNEYYSKYLGREWLNVGKSSFEEFESFFKKHSVVFLKTVDGFRGNGVRRLNSLDVDCLSLYNELLNDHDISYILEEEIHQIKILNDFHPWSINTIRIVTLYDKKNDIVNVMNARIRLGNNMNSVDNLHFGGIGANIDIVTGIINSVGRDSKNNTYIYHPITFKQIVGFKVPFWKECIDFVCGAARLLPTVRYIGWDIVIQDNGNFLLIEANDNADHDFQQFFCGGLWYKYKSLM